MITDSFLNLCCAVLSDENPKFTDAVISEVFEVLTFFKLKENTIPIQYRSKFNLTHTISKLRKEGKTIEETIENIIAAGQFKDLDSYIHSLSRPEAKIPEKKIESGLKRLKAIKKLTTLLKDLPNIEKFIEQFNTNNFTNLDEAINNYDVTVSKMYSRLSEEKRLESQGAIRSLDLASDSYAPVIDQIEISYSGKNSITTGYSELDKLINKGFEPGRLYIFGASSGDGKSVLLMNFVKNGVERQKEDLTKKDIYIYITLENLIDESLVRLYCGYSNKTIDQVIKNYDVEKVEIERSLKTWQDSNNAVIAMSYYPPTLTSVADTMVFIEEVKNRYKDTGKIKAVYIDYLDLLKSGQTFDLHRLELGQTTIDLKVLAVRLQVPVITVTQVNRAGYDHKEAISLVHMSESIKKVEHADFVAMMRAVVPEGSGDHTSQLVTDTIDLQIYIGKNRSGPKNKMIHLNAKFSTFRIDDKNKDLSVSFKDINTKSYDANSDIDLMKPAKEDVPGI